MLEQKQIASVYSGQNGKCCCGCAGKHYYSSDWVKEASEDRGYDVGPEEVSDRMIKRVTNILIKLDAVGDIDDKIEGRFWSAVVGNRLYVAYFKQEPKVKVEATVLDDAIDAEIGKMDFQI